MDSTHTKQIKERMRINNIQLAKCLFCGNQYFRRLEKGKIRNRKNLIVRPHNSLTCSSKCSRDRKYYNDIKKDKIKRQPLTIQEKKEQRKKTYIKNKKKILKQQKEYREKNKDKIKKYYRTRYLLKGY